MIATGIYNAGLQLYKAGVYLAALAGKTKARRWLEGRQHWQSRMRKNGIGSQPVVWIHAASLGEFEQGRPVLEAIRAAWPSYKILLTFFSPSGYEVRKDYKGADYVCYLPLDTRGNARDFLDIVQPALAIFIKYEFWYHYLTTLHQRNIPTLLVSGIFRPDQVFFKGYGGMFRGLLQQLTHIFVQNEASLQLLRGIGLQNSSISGDTRFDRVAALLNEHRELPEISIFAGEKRLVVAGSTWPADEKILSDWWKEKEETDIKLILAPHEIDDSHIQSVLALFPGAQRFSELKNGNSRPGDVLIIDNIGMLTTLYRYAVITYVGGGFGKDGIHNILEPAAYSKPVIIGPEFGKYFEAVELVAAGGALVVHNYRNLHTQMERLLADRKAYAETAAIAGNYVAANTGATQKVLNYIQEKRFLSNE
ncbi:MULTISPECIES: glycosyltransferase N-terminal domain-containing protein [Chitinophaga]|uniref:glycosyltransferase N-terminal domain-containing protein n=1 Tax=Chitinophaga TaxID=79328 RepID=UPI000DBAB3FB|nr:glycosyltransferase N-terminal domain-containing protein [Chitinophaga ginsengisegetis]MDR6566671.1 3-deoxy-D-manno-octulosonic-acid transferase [Chitinophaga ginsengisegetis]MDR6646401.1 3-deoxy-D-manno-octulosonic-acid transferase [Chitinophaga ginsengisegetis]MDR6652751.1 3-deoxy-D-manno-octulosonic-acid transferase [Chitinophaga ginsengisegetis]